MSRAVNIISREEGRVTTHHTFVGIACLSAATETVEKSREAEKAFIEICLEDQEVLFNLHETAWNDGDDEETKNVREDAIVSALNLAWIN